MTDDTIHRLAAALEQIQEAYNNLDDALFEDAKQEILAAYRAQPPATGAEGAALKRLEKAVADINAAKPILLFATPQLAEDITVLVALAQRQREGSQ